MAKRKPKTSDSAFAFGIARHVAEATGKASAKPVRAKKLGKRKSNKTAKKIDKEEPGYQDVPHLSNARLLKMAGKYQPPQSWYDEDTEGLF